MEVSRGKGKFPATEDSFPRPPWVRFRGKLESITEKEVIFSQQSDPKQPGMLIRLPRESSAPFDTVARIGLGAAGELSVASLEFRDGTAHLHTAFADDLELPATALNAVSDSGARSALPMKGESLVFKNGDELPGALDLRLPRRALALEDIRRPGSRDRTQKRCRHPPRRSRASKTGAESAYVELRNGDRLRGGIVSFDEHRLGLKEPLLGPLSVDRSRIWKTLSPSRRGRFATEPTIQRAG
jgi:hypothetical protein